jgi:hypothetical protein
VDCRHKGQEVVDGPIEISDEEADRQSQENIERWVSAHIVPVSVDCVLLTVVLIPLLFVCSNH